jgi:hypothetical protein
MPLNLLLKSIFCCLWKCFEERGGLEWEAGVPGAGWCRRFIIKEWDGLLEKVG